MVSDDAGPLQRGYGTEILLMSFAALLLEISYTRVVSFKLYYYYTYLVIGLALLGIGTGGVLVTISPRLRRAATDTILMWGLLLGAASVGVGYVIVARIRTDTIAIWDYGTLASLTNLARLLVICMALFASFVAVGVMIATLFSRRSEQIGRLYFADLVGAGLACAVVVSLLGAIGPPATILLAGLILALAGLRIAWRRRSRALPGAAVLTALLGVVVVAPGLLPPQRADAAKENLDEQRTFYSSWSALFRVDVSQLEPNARLLFHDGLLGSAIYRFNGDRASLGRYKTDPRSLPFAVTEKRPKRVLIIGAAGGNEVLASLYFRAAHIDAVELNPVTYSLVTHDFADYAGHLAQNRKVNYVRGDGRAYLARSDNAYDLVWFPATDSYSAVNAATAGAFVLSESYLYTSNAIVDSLEHLGRNGILAMQFGEWDYNRQPNRSARYVATARHALGELGIHDPSRHVIVVTTPAAPNTSLSTILVKRKPFTRADVDRFVTGMAVPGAKVRYAPGRGVPRDPVSSLATIPSSRLAAWYDSYPFDVRPITDDAPFFWHFTSFRDVLRNFADPIDRKSPLELGVGERVLVLLLAVATAFAAVFLLLPFVAIRRTWVRLPRKRRSAVYFASLGLGFMLFEITLIQRLVLFLGYPTYSLTLTLASILTFTGLGALLSARYKRQPNRVVPTLLAAITGLTVFYEFGLPRLTDALLGWPMAGRALLAFVVLAPLGICLGAFMPLGLGAVADLSQFAREYVAWGWAVNGFASVVGSVLTTILAMAVGFRVVLFLALVAYVVAIAALRGLLGTAPKPAPAVVTVEPVKVEASL